MSHKGHGRLSGLWGDSAPGVTPALPVPHGRGWHGAQECPLSCRDKVWKAANPRPEQRGGAAGGTGSWQLPRESKANS